MKRKPNRPASAARKSPVVTRRRVLQAGGAVAAASLPAGKAAAAQPVGPVMAALGSYMAAARERPLPDAVIEIGRASCRERV